MAELARGTIADRPWGITFGALGMRGLSGQLTLAADGKLFCVAFAGGAVVGATSPLLNDAAVRVALTGGLVSSTQAADISRRLAGAPDRDELDVITEHLRLTPDQTQRLRRRVIAQRAARTFSIERGEFVVEDRVRMPVLRGSELDIRAVIYLGARANLTEGRLAAELSGLGAWFQIKRDMLGDLPQYGFTETERPILEMLVTGANLVELETAHPEIDARGVHAIVYALVSCGACEIDAEPRANLRQPRLPTPPPVRNTTTPPTGSRTVTRSAPPSSARTQTRQTPVGGTAIPRTTPPTPRTGVEVSPVMTRASNEPPLEPRAQPTTTVPPGSRGSSPGPVGSPTPSTPSSGVPAMTRGSSPGFPRARTEPPAAAEDLVRMKQPSGGPGMTLKPLTEARAQRHSSRPPPNQRKDDAATIETEALIAEKLPLVDAGADHFTLLGIAREAQPDQIRSAYFNLARKLHPDRLASLGITDAKRNAQRLFAQVNAAFAVLSDNGKATTYLSMLDRGGEAAVRAEEERADELATKILRAEEAFRRGEMALRRDAVAQAVAEFQTAVELHPNEPEYHTLLAWAKFAEATDKAAMAAETRAALTKAADASDKTVTARFYLGRVERMLGREKEAIGHFEYVLMLKPSHVDAQSELRVLQSRLKKR